MVTGAASGMGAATAALLCRSGDRVLGVDRVAGQGVDIVADLSDPEGRRCVVEQVAARAAASLVVGATVVSTGGRTPCSTHGVEARP